MGQGWLVGCCIAVKYGLLGCGQWHMGIVENVRNDAVPEAMYDGSADGGPVRGDNYGVRYPEDNQQTRYQ